MKVGILSMQRIHNYGSFMQALALKRIMEERGHSVSFVDIQSKPHHGPSWRTKIISKIGKLKNVDKYLFRRMKDSKKNRQLDAIFFDYQKRYLQIGTEWMSADQCDAVLIGSDEIFNCDSACRWGITGQRFGDIPGVNLVVSYAASCGYANASDLDDADRSVVERALKGMDGISVRDKNTRDFVRQMTGKVPLEHLDPVLIYDFEKLRNLECEIHVPEVPYMVVYAYHNRIESGREIEAIRAYAQAHRLKTIAIGGSLPWCDEFAVLSPFEVLAYFQNAACIVTDTFHGTIFSVKARRPFAVLVRDSNANKLNDLLERLDVAHHRVSDMSSLWSVLSQQDDLRSCYAILAREQARAHAYIESVGL